MNQWLKSVDVPERGTVWNKHPEEFLYGGYSPEQAAQFRNCGWNNVHMRSAAEYELVGEYPGRNAGLFASRAPGPQLVPLGYMPPPKFVVGPRAPRMARFSIETEQ
jgi:hypothetical protein